MKFTINPGEFKHKIVIQRCLTKTNNDGILEEVYEDIFTTRAKVLNVRGNEFLQAQGIGSNIEKTFYIRSIPRFKITNDDRVIYNDEIYNIAYINDIEDRGIYLEIKAGVIK